MSDCQYHVRRAIMYQMPANKVVALSQRIWEIDCGVGLAVVASYERCNHHLVQV